MGKAVARKAADEAAEAYEARVQGELDEQYRELKQDARATLRAVKGRRGVRSEEDWDRIFEVAGADYRSGRFLVERLGAERYLDPKLMATLTQLRQGLIVQFGADDPAQTMLIDLAVLAYYNSLRLQGWIGNLCLVTERELFGQEPLHMIFGEIQGSALEDRLRRLGEQLLPLQERANRMMVRNLKALDELKRGPAPTVAVGRADQVNVAQQQVAVSKGNGSRAG